jgi:hypothetical protein
MHRTVGLCKRKPSRSKFLMTGAGGQMGPVSSIAVLAQHARNKLSGIMDCNVD